MRAIGGSGSWLRNVLSGQFAGGPRMNRIVGAVASSVMSNEGDSKLCLHGGIAFGAVVSMSVPSLADAIHSPQVS